MLEFYRGKKVFVTGHTGFKGAWLCAILADAGAEVTGYALDPPTEPSLFRIAGLEGGITSVIGDIRDGEKLDAAVKKASPEIAFHLAAQPLVRDGYEKPRYTYETNVMGTVNFLESLRAAGTARSVVNVTTDKVYQNDDSVKSFREGDILDGYDPYSNSKSCSDILTHCYYNSFFEPAGVAVSRVRAGNVIGGGDFAANRILPDCIRAASRGRVIEIRNPSSVRPYQHVLEALSAYLAIAAAQFCEPSLSGCYNIGPDESDCVSTGELADIFCGAWGDGARWESKAQPGAPHEAGYLMLDSSLANKTFGIKRRWSVRQAVEKTCEWTRAWLDGGDVEAEMTREINEFFAGE